MFENGCFLRRQKRFKLADKPNKKKNKNSSRDQNGSFENKDEFKSDFKNFKNEIIEDPQQPLGTAIASPSENKAQTEPATADTNNQQQSSPQNASLTQNGVLQQSLQDQILQTQQQQQFLATSLTTSPATSQTQSTSVINSVGQVYYPPFQLYNGNTDFTNAAAAAGLPNLTNGQFSISQLVEKPLNLDYSYLYGQQQNSVPDYQSYTLYRWVLGNFKEGR